MEQKVTTILGSLNYTRKVKYKVPISSDFLVMIIRFNHLLFKQYLSRWDDGPPLNEVSPVLIEFHDKKEKCDVYASLSKGLDNSGYVVTEDSRSSKNE